MPTEPPPTCGLCGHAMAIEQCGWASVNDTYLCHADDHDCYGQWTLYGKRPEADQ